MEFELNQIIAAVIFVIILYVCFRVGAFILKIAIGILFFILLYVLGNMAYHHFF